MSKATPRWLLLALTLAACSTLTEDDEKRLATFKFNSKRFYEEGQFQRAEDQCRKGLLLEPEDVSLRQVLGYSLLRQGSPPDVYEAVQTFESCVDLEDEFDFRNRLGLGEAQFQLGQIWLTKETQVERDEKLTQDERATQREQARAAAGKSFGAAEAALREVLASPRGRDDSMAKNTLARLLALTNRYEDAAGLLRSLTDQLGSSIRLRTEQLSTASLPVERRELLDEQLEQLRQEHLRSLGLLATVSAKLGRDDEVIATYAQIDAQKAMLPADFYNRAQAYERLGSRDAAIADYQSFVRQAASRGSAFDDNVAEALARITKLQSGPAAAKSP